LTELEQPLAAGVSVREAEVLAGIAAHLTNAEIAARLFISVRTVESHVSSLLRKTGAADRRALAGLAAGKVLPAATRPASLPVPLTPFVGRAAELTELTGALAEHRLVTAVGTGGIGKTRLALAVAAEVTDRFADGVWYVDLVPVTDSEMVAPVLAQALGLGEQHGRSAEDTVLGWLGGRTTLLVLDNCEHLMDGVVVLVERLLAACPGVKVLATSRARLLVPYERVFSVPGLTVSKDGGDAVELFLGRVTATGGPAVPAGTADHHRVAGICRGLDGVALAIELAAARLPALGLDGLEDGLADRLRLLAGGRRLDDRHRSLRSTVDWSFALLTEAERAILRRVSVFATPFTAEAASALVTGWPPADAAETAAGLAALTDHSLLIAAASPGGTRYRALETIRQYGAERLDDAGELTQTQVSHLGWCLVEARALDEELVLDRPEGRAAFDRLAGELRAALDWASTRPDQRAGGHQLAVRLAELCFARGLPGEAQRRYEQAASLAADDQQAAWAFHHAASAAEARHFGNDAIRLLRAGADAALAAGDRPRAAYDLAKIAELIARAPGLMSQAQSLDLAERAIAEASALASDDPAAQARVLVAQAFLLREQHPGTAELIERAIVLAQKAADPLAESAALDLVTSMHAARSEVQDAQASAARRTRLLAPLRRRPAATGMEIHDAYQMATETAIAAGDLAAARGFADQVRALPFYREEGHLATARLLVVTALAGDLHENVELGELFRDGWERAGRPRAGNLNRGSYAALAVCGLRGDEDGRAEWLTVVNGMITPTLPLSEVHHGEFFDALVLLHRDQPDDALALLVTPPEEFTSWYNGLWRPWYAALWAEAAVLTGHPSATDRIERAMRCAEGNPIAAAIIDRAAALAAAQSDVDSMLAAAERLRTAGCRYQWARTLVLAGDPHRARGEDELAAMGATVTPRR
jgi:predicted ATPase/DNA-binding CsgD family transcriptional regulator